MTTKVRMRYEPMREISGASVTGTYQAIGSPLNNPLQLIIFQNTTSQNARISLDGITDFLYLPANTSFVIDISTNSTFEDGLFLGAETTVFVKDDGVALGAGSIFVTAIYGT